MSNSWTVQPGIILVLRAEIVLSQVKRLVAGLTAPIGANGSPLDVVGQIKMPVHIGTFETEQVAIYCCYCPYCGLPVGCRLPSSTWCYR